jgi:hypothetical protein
MLLFVNCFFLYTYSSINFNINSINIKNDLPEPHSPVNNVYLLLNFFPKFIYFIPF